VFFVLVIILLALYAFFKGDQSEYKKAQMELQLQIYDLEQKYNLAQDSISTLLDSISVVDDSIVTRKERIVEREVKYVYVKSEKERAYSHLDTAGRNDKQRYAIATADSIRAITAR
jgi:hypothetical protein